LCMRSVIREDYEDDVSNRHLWLTSWRKLKMKILFT
jgi:hypothetical protein